MRDIDGQGNAIDPDAMYFIQDIRSVVGNCALWWRGDGAGYTCDLAEAGLYAGRAVGDRDTDIAWPEAFVRANTITHVRVERLDRSAMPVRKRRG